MPDTPIYIPDGVLANPLDADDVIRVDRSGKTMYTRVEEFASDPAFAAQYAPGARQGVIAPVQSAVAWAGESGHGWGFVSGNTATNSLNDTTYAPMGSQSVKQVSNGAGGAARIGVSGLTINMTGKNPVVWLMVEDVENTQSIQLLLLDAAGTASYGWTFEPSASSSRGLKSGIFTRVTLPWDDAVVAGSPNRAALTQARIYWTDKNSTPVTLHLLGVGAQAEPTQYPNGVCVFTFDDARQTQLLARASLDRYGLSATAFPIIERVDSAANFLTLAELKALRDVSGWEIACHASTTAAHDGDGFPALAAAGTLEAEFWAMKRWAAINGFSGEHLAYPQGKYDADVLTSARDFFTSARTTNERSGETLPVGDQHQIRITSLQSTTTLVAAKARIDIAKAASGMVVFMGHEIRDDIDTLSWTQADFDDLVDYAVAQGVAVRTLGQALHGV